MNGQERYLENGVTSKRKTGGKKKSQGKGSKMKKKPSLQFKKKEKWEG